MSGRREEPIIRRIYTNHLLCSGCRACSVACAVAHFGVADDARGAIQILRDPFAGYEFQAVCRMCEEPECVAACMAMALTIDTQSGHVLFDRNRCVGCRMCVMVCPHHAIVPDQRAGKAIICDQCVDRDTPACAAACATSAIAFVDTADEEETG
ncbi:MAG: 4Fe-4S dicluster domain-containing protein [Candidatus Latescibacterota bacterium]